MSHSFENNENNSLCKKCGGGCCKSLPGAVDPSEFKEITVETLLNKFKEGFCFDYWEGELTNDPEYKGLTGYFMRPQTLGHVKQIVHASWGGRCRFLNDTGCPFKYKDRPLGCRSLIPSKNLICQDDNGYGKKQSAIAWLPYNKIIEEVIRKVEDAQES